MASSDVQIRLRVLAPVEPGLSSLKLRDEGGSISATEGRTLHEQTPKASSPFWEGGVPWRRASQCDRQALAYRSSSPPDLPELRSHVAGPTGYSGERSGVRVFCPPGESRGNLCYVAHLSLAQFPLHPVCDSCNLFFKSKGNNRSLPVFPGNITCFRPCRKGRGCCSPNHHVLSPHASLACVQTRPQGLGGFSWTRGSGKEESLLPPAGDVPASVLLPPDGVLGLWQWVRRGFLCHGVTS